MSAPISMGEKIIGVNVLSTTSVRLCSLASLDISRMSATSSRGLLRTSQYRTLVFSWIAARTASRLLVSTKVVVNVVSRQEMLHESMVPP